MKYMNLQDNTLVDHSTYKVTKIKIAPIPGKSGRQWRLFKRWLD